MARSDLARTQPPNVASKKRRSRGRKRNGDGPPARKEESAFSELEQAFFAAAPPDEPPATPAAERFEDQRLDAAVAAAPLGREAWFEALRWAAVTTRVALGRFVPGARGQRDACR